jgi:hypothetical protein
MLLKVWFFAYCDRSWHCREVARRVRYDVRYRYYVGSHRPDFRTLNRFRHDQVDVLVDCFAALVSHCEALGLIDSSVLALDGTKLRANASGRKHRRGALRDAIGRRLREDIQSDTLVEEGNLGGSAERGGPPSPPVSATDPDARLMKTGEGPIRFCYNAQVVVDNHQIIVAADVGTDADDKSSLPPMVAQAKSRMASPLGAIVADGGYYSGRNLKYAHKQGLDMYIPKGRDERAVFGQEQFVYDPGGDRYRCPNGCWLKRGRQRQRYGVRKTTYSSTMKQCRGCRLKAACTRERFRRLEVAETAAYERAVAMKLATPEGQAIYARRRELVEPVFGNLKFNLGFTRFSLRGLAKVKGEFLLLCIAHNLKKLSQWSGGRRVVAVFRAGLLLFLTRINRCQTRFQTSGAIGRYNHLGTATF